MAVDGFEQKEHSWGKSQTSLQNAKAVNVS